MADTNTTTYRRFQCRHIYTGGHRCGSPCLRGEDFCFYHHGTHTQKAIPTVDLSQGEHRAAPFTLPAPDLNDRGAIQQAIGEILNRLAANQLDPRRAGLLLYGLQIASLNLPRAAAEPPQKGSLVEETVTDPELGTLALPTELPDPNAPRPNSLTALLLAELTRNRTESNPADPNTTQTPPSNPFTSTQEPGAPFFPVRSETAASEPPPDPAQPTTLPTLQATGEPTAPTETIFGNTAPQTPSPVQHFSAPHLPGETCAQTHLRRLHCRPGPHPRRPRRHPQRQRHLCVRGHAHRNPHP